MKLTKLRIRGNYRSTPTKIIKLTHQAHGIFFSKLFGLLCFHPIYYLRPFFSLSFLIVTQIRRVPWQASSPPRRHYGPCLAFLSRQDFTPCFSRRFASNCAYPRHRLLSADVFRFFLLAQKKHQKSRHGGIRTPEPTLTVFEGNHYAPGATG